MTEISDERWNGIKALLEMDMNELNRALIAIVASKCKSATESVGFIEAMKFNLQLNLMDKKVLMQSIKMGLDGKDLLAGIRKDGRIDGK